MLQAHGSGIDWLGLTNVAIPAGLSLDETAAALAKPVQLGCVEQHGERGAIYQLTGEGRRIAIARQGPAELYFPQAARAASPQWPAPPAAHAPGPPGPPGPASRTNSSPVSGPRPGPQ